MTETNLRKEIREAFLDQGIEESHFFNGRLLTATDLTTGQKASRLRDYQLGLGLGTGVVGGLEVGLVSNGIDGKPPVLSVKKGLGFNPLGQAVALSLDAEVALSKTVPEKLPESGFFPAPCLPAQSDGGLVTGKGAYVFVARPVNELRGQAPRRGFGSAAKVEGCDRDVQVEGVLFRLVSVDVTKLDRVPEATRSDLVDLLEHADDIGSAALPQTLSNLRNRLAHACLGTEELAAFSGDPFKRLSGASAYASYGVVDALEDQGLLDACDLPLALVLWTVTGVKWVDMWSVRRRLHSQAASFFGAMPASSRRQAEAEATFFQFQGHLEQLMFLGLGTTALQLLQARDYFRYLPPVGFVPLAGPTTSQAFTPQRFFREVKVRPPLNDPLYIQGDVVTHLVMEALPYPPIDLESPELVWLYRVRQNGQAVDTGTPPVSYPYILFTNGHVPYRADARFDMAYFNYSNFA